MPEFIWQELNLVTCYEALIANLGSIRHRARALTLPRIRLPRTRVNKENPRSREGRPRALGGARRPYSWGAMGCTRLDSKLTKRRMITRCQKRPRRPLEGNLEALVGIVFHLQNGEIGGGPPAPCFLCAY